MNKLNATGRIQPVYNSSVLVSIFRDLESMVDYQTYSFTPVFTGLTVVGATTYTGKLKKIGSQCFFQVTLLAATSIASVAGTTYMALPITAAGIAGMGEMSNDTTNISVGNCHIDTTTSRCYLPSQLASGNTFTLSGWYEING